MLIRVLDFETTGLPPGAAVCEVGWTDVQCQGEAVLIGRPQGMLVNPNRPMPPEARAIHHISDAELVDAPAIETGFLALSRPVKPDVFVAHNAQFEREFFTGGDTPWICTRKVAMRLWPESPNHQNQTLRYFLGIGEGDDEFDLDAHPPHRAGPDTLVTAHIFVAAMEKASVDEMIDWTSRPALLPSPMRFGKHRGKPWEDAPRDYRDWIVKKSDMDEDVKFTARHHLKGAR